MSDEEKKAIEKLSSKKNETTWDDTIRQIKREEIKDVVVTRQKYITVVINLIEKQSKEIEKLKEVKWYYEISRVPKDKIKAKIEPKLKELDEQMKKEWKEYGNSREYQDMEDEWNFLQSLLEKE